MYGAAAGTFTAGLVIAGQSPGTIANTESWDGTAWTERADVNTGRTALNPQNIGTQVAALIGSGAVPPTTNVTEEFNEAGADSTLLNEGQIWYNTTGGALKYTSVAAGTWASATSLPASVCASMYCGTQTAGLLSGGVPGNVTTAYTYDGSSWTAVNAMGTGRGNNMCAGIGTQTAGMVMGGEIPAPPYNTADTEWYDGTSWTQKNDLINARQLVVGAGDQAGALCISGAYPAGTTLVESWDGTSWTAGTAAPEAKYGAMGGGTQTSALQCGGKAGPATTFNTADVWNGTAWTEVANMNQNRSAGAAAATSETSALVYGGEIPPRTAVNEQWDGTSWTELADLATAANKNTGNGTVSAAISVGNESPNNGAVEEWNATTLTVKTVTVS